MSCAASVRWAGCVALVEQVSTCHCPIEDPHPKMEHSMVSVLADQKVAQAERAEQVIDR